MTLVHEQVFQTGADLRRAIRAKEFTRPTAGVAAGFVQANVAILPKSLAFDFLLFCQRNPKPCPIIEVLEPGQTQALWSAKGSDIRTDVSRYRIYQHGDLVAETNSLMPWWREDLVTFLLGCSFSFEHALVCAGIELPYFGSGGNVPMFITNIATEPAGAFAGSVVVSQRWVEPHRVADVFRMTQQYDFAHGTPIHVGDGRSIGITDPFKPDFGEPWVPEDEHLVPMYWACGVTPQVIAISCKTELMITHAPGHMFVTDKRHEDMV